MGLLEFLNWCEDLDMEPVLDVFSGYTLDRKVVPPEEYGKYAQEAVDEIEYCIGDVSTTWGARRAKDGHPAPFKLTYVEIGNEEANPTYDARFAAFYDAIKAKYPQLQVISASRSLAMSRKPDMIDEHYYFRSVNTALGGGKRYDNRTMYTPTAARVFVGEWATRIGDPTPNHTAALGDAGFLTALERNSDVVIMSCYAPLFVNVNPGAMQWATDLIGYDALNSFGSPSYYVQAMFSNNRGDVVLPVKVDVKDLPLVAGAPVTSVSVQPSIFAAASLDKSSGEVIVKVVNLLPAAQMIEITLQGAQRVGSVAKATVITGSPTDVNTIAEPKKVAPKETTISNAGEKFKHEFPASSVTVFRFNTQ
jgi:alpha-N-arabinofuranosidase